MVHSVGMHPVIVGDDGEVSSSCWHVTSIAHGAVPRKGSDAAIFDENKDSPRIGFGLVIDTVRRWLGRPDGGPISLINRRLYDTRPLIDQSRNWLPRALNLDDKKGHWWLKWSIERESGMPGELEVGCSIRW